MLLYGCVPDSAPLWGPGDQLLPTINYLISLRSYLLGIIRDAVWSVWRPEGRLLSCKRLDTFNYPYFKLC